MPTIDKATGRVVALVVLLVVAGVALRGYVPGAERVAEERPSNNPATLIALVTLLAVAVVVVGVAIISNLRAPVKPADTSARELPRMVSSERGRPRWRVLLIGLGVILVWLLCLVLLARLNAPDVVDPADSPPATESPTDSPTESPPPPPPPDSPESGGTVLWYLAATTVIMLVLFAIGAVVAISKRRRPDDLIPLPDEDSPTEPTVPGASLALAAERGLAEIVDLSREPGEAIIACYAAMEHALANAPGAAPQDSDTPSEVLARAVEHHAIHDDSARQLVDLFAEARFSVHVMNEGHRDAAFRGLQLVLAELRSPATGSAAT